MPMEPSLAIHGFWPSLALDWVIDRRLGHADAPINQRDQVMGADPQAKVPIRILRRLLTRAVLRGHPKRLELVEAHRYHVAPRASGIGLHAAKPALEFGVRASRGRFRIDPEAACQIGHGENEIADLIADGVLTAAVEGCLAFGELFPQLRENRPRRLPIEADARGACLQLFGSREGRQCERDAVEEAFRRSCLLARLLLSL